MKRYYWHGGAYWLNIIFVCICFPEVLPVYIFVFWCTGVVCLSLGHLRFVCVSVTVSLSHITKLSMQIRLDQHVTKLVR